MHTWESFYSAAQSGRLPFLSERFREITCDAPDDIVRQLAGRDLVHDKGVSSVDELRRYRLGGNGVDRTCFAIMDGDNKKIESAIYVAKFTDPIVSDRDYCGNVANILMSDARSDDRGTASLIFYSISNIGDMRGAGPMLVSNLHLFAGVALPFAKASTLSPLRSFDAEFSTEDRDRFIVSSTVQQKKTVLAYLLTGCDPVQQFHMSNGARIADIKLLSGDKSVNPKTGEVRNHLAMVNYAYDVSRGQLDENAVAFAVVKKALRDKDMPEDVRRNMVFHGILPRVSACILEDAGFSPMQPAASVPDRRLEF